MNSHGLPAIILVQVCVCVYACVCMCMCACVYMCVYVSVCMCAYMCVYEVFTKRGMLLLKVQEAYECVEWLYAICARN